ncbi:PilS cassette [Neisseria meningitidis serogroup B]|uniref:PilS cassette n=1 Tax=Neisseria meningitidis serogroup B TaxID=491 RepID=A0A0H5Q971_NEIMI|nr:PilS cassette [Neisseria meningitidis serogroup B]
MTGFEIAAFIRSNRSRSAVIPTKVGIQFLEFQSFPINCLSIECLDSRLRGNDESIHTETCTTSFPRTYIPSFPRKWESSFLSFSHSR